jgi:hypothetical protein
MPERSQHRIHVNNELFLLSNDIDLSAGHFIEIIMNY